MFLLNKMVKHSLLVLAVLSPLMALSAPTVDEIVNRANRAAYYQGRDGRALVHMTITDAQERTRERRLTILRRDAAVTDEVAGQAYRDEQKFYIYFHRPADVNKMVFMVWKHLQKDDDRWLYLPALDLVKRIAASDERTSFVGSNFYYEDVSGRDIDEDKHELMEETDHYYVLKSVPTDPSNVEFAWYKSFIHKTTFIPVQVEYYDERDEKYRVASAQEVETIQGYPTVTQSRMDDIRSGGHTVMEFLKVEYDVGIEEDIFSERYLRRAPRKHLR